MPIDLANFEDRATIAVKSFWNTRGTALQAQLNRAIVKDQGERGAVTSGKNMDGFVDLIHEIVVANGSSDFSIHRTRRLITLPGYYRSTKQWDILVMYKSRLIAAIELKSQIGPSFGNNFNNRCEESIGTATDLLLAYRENAFGDSLRPFIGFIMLIEDFVEVQRHIQDISSHFPVFPEFANTGYAERYAILFDRLMKEHLYDSVALLLSDRHSGSSNGSYREMNQETSLKRFVAQLAGRIASEVAI